MGANFAFGGSVLSREYFPSSYFYYYYKLIWSACLRVRVWTQLATRWTRSTSRGLRNRSTSSGTCSCRSSHCAATYNTTALRTTLEVGRSTSLRAVLVDTAHIHTHTHTHTHTRLMALFPGLPGWAGTRKVK